MKIGHKQVGLIELAKKGELTLENAKDIYGSYTEALSAINGLILAGKIKLKSENNWEYIDELGE